MINYKNASLFITHNIKYIFASTNKSFQAPMIILFDLLYNNKN